MKGVFETMLLFGIVIFLGLLFIMGQSFIATSTTLQGFVNGTNGTEVSGLQTGGLLVNPPVCTFDATGIEIIDGILGAGVCLGAYIGYLYGFLGLASENPLLSVFFGGVIAVMGLLAFRMVRGN